jgi:hypothetical protein
MYKVLPEYIEKAAKELAEMLNGGNWETHYTKEQKIVWINRIKLALNQRDLV